uniref:Protein kinase domain-containing protein n=1 Tax=Peronospora matthiolae TaxID=2874970 RepID=A0AAV1U8A4_9STRA
MEDGDVYVREEGDRPMEHSPRGRYIRFDIRLGTGAYKSVYKAYDTDQGIDVAWNAIDIGLLPSTEKTRIIQEVQLLQKLEHKNIINFYGSWFCKEKNQVVFITEIMTSGTLKSYIKRVQFIKWKIIKRWCIQILEGLHYLHSQNPPVIHRDLKCDNIFVNGNTGDLRIGDLGLSTQLAVDKRSKAQSVLGTPEFMAPELYDESYDEKVDIYAFGMCVLEMVTKEVPYSECINPAQIYKKVTAGIRPRGLQRVVSQAACDFIELCLSRGNGLVDVTAQYLLDHPFLKAQDDDNDMVECLDEDKLERGAKEAQQRLERVAEESFAVEFNMEGGSKDSVASAVSGRRTQFTSLSSELDGMSAMSSVSGATSAPGSVTSASVPFANVSADVNMTGTNRLIMVPPAGADGNTVTPSPSTGMVPQLSSGSASALTPTPLMLAPLLAPSPAPIRTPTPPPEESPKLTYSLSQPFINEMVSADEPLSKGKKSVDTHVDQFLATLPGSESAIQNTRINIMGGRGHRLDLENDVMPKYAESPVESPLSSSVETPGHLQSFAGEHTAAYTDAAEHSQSASGMFMPHQQLEGPIPSMQLPERDMEPQVGLTRRASIHDPFNTVAASEAASRQPASPPQATSQSAASSANARKRAKRHEIKAVKDPDNEHSILLNLRIIIDGKSKEIKFPFNLFADSPHEVACELAVDVGILEPDLEDIADSIRFLVTEGKINNLSDVQEDVWEEAPEPHSFSSIPFPNVSKMSLVHTPPDATAHQQPQIYLPSLESTPSASPEVPAFVHQSVLGTSSTASATLSGMQAPPEGESSVSQESVHAARLSDSSATLMAPEGGSSSGSSSESAHPQFSGNEPGRSPPRPGLLHSASESGFTTEALMSILEQQARGVSMGSIVDPTYAQQIHQLEDRLKVARSSFDDRESSLEAAIRSEEEKHQREIERFRKKMEEFDKQRAAIARQQNGESAVVYDANGGSSPALNESLRLLAQGESLANTSGQIPSVVRMECDGYVSLPGDGSEVKSCPPPSASASVPVPVSGSAASEADSSTEGVASPASVPVDELIPESYFTTCGTIGKTGTDATNTTANQVASGHS